jgi:signal transduction histidine kinase
MEYTAMLEELKRAQEEKKLLLDLQHDMIREMDELSHHLQNAERFKSDFLSNVRNEINNPLMAIMGLSQNIGQCENLDKVQRWAEIIHKEAFNLNFLLQNIFVAAEIEAGVAIPQSAVIDLHDFMLRQVDHLKSKANDQNVSIRYTGKNHRLFRTDASMLQIIIRNLLSEAIDFSPAGESVYLETDTIDDQLILTVTDAGIDVDTKDLHYIFERLRQLNHDATHHNRGYALSLSVVKELTDRLNGQINVVSENNNFTVIKICLPEFKPAVCPEGFSPDGQELFFGEEEVL